MSALKHGVVPEDVRTDLPLAARNELRRRTLDWRSADVALMDISLSGDRYRAAEKRAEQAWQRVEDLSRELHVCLVDGCWGETDPGAIHCSRLHRNL